MANTLTLSVTPQDIDDLEKNPSWSASKIFRGAMKLQRRMESFTDVYSLDGYIELILKMQSKIMFLQGEILKREEKIESLKNVLEEKIVAERRLREIKQSNSGGGQESGNLEELRRQVGEQSHELTWPRKQEN